MAATAAATKNVITLKGSVAIVTEFFGYSINSILYQRGIYPPESFATANQYGLSMMVSTDDGLKKYLGQVLGQLSTWLTTAAVQKLVVVISGVDSGDVLERWVFNVETDKSVTNEEGSGREKSTKEIQNEIRALIRQITATVTFLPLLDEPCTFDLLVYTDADAEVPRTWEESDPKYIQKSTEVRLRSFTTRVHKVDTLVAYKADEDDDDV